MSEPTLVRRPLEIAIALAIALVIVGVVLSALRWVLVGGPAVFDGRMMETGASALAMALWMLFGLVVVVLVIWFFFAAIAPVVAPRGMMQPRDWSSFGAIAELKKRYARGEVSREDFLRVLADLEGAQAPAPTPVQK